MKTQYLVLSVVMLTFLTPQDSYDAMIDPGAILEADASTIWLVKEGGKRAESITTANAISIWLSQGRIEKRGASQA